VIYLGDDVRDTVEFRMLRILHAQGHCRTLSVGAPLSALPVRLIVYGRYD
jgi:hypothetical protein